MRITEWDERYRSGAPDDFDAPPTPLVKRFAAQFAPGRALDLACGTGRNALYLAANGWYVTAVDGAPAAIEIVRERARSHKLRVDAHVADLETSNSLLSPNTFDLVCDCYYLQRDLIPVLQAAVKPGGVVIVIVHTVEKDEVPTQHRTALGELRSYFANWKVLHDYEGPPEDEAHKRVVAEIVARRPRLTVT